MIIYIYVLIYIYIYLYIYIYVLIYISILIHIYILIYIHTFIYTYTYIYLSLAAASGYLQPATWLHFISAKYHALICLAYLNSLTNTSYIHMFITHIDIFYPYTSFAR